MKNILVTGATGFIGSYLIPILSEKNYKISIAIHNKFPKFSDLSITNIKVGEIDSNTNWQEALKEIDIVIHLAARAHMLQDNHPNPEAEFLRINTEGTANLVKQSIQNGVKHFIFVSSIGAMATLSNQILTENSLCIPDSYYGISKLRAEEKLIELAKNSKITWTILRPTLVYGAGNPGNMERLIKLIKTGFPLPFGAIKNRRSFLYVENLVDAIATILTNKNATNQIFLVSDSEDISTPQLINFLAQYQQQSCKLLPIPSLFLKILGYVGDVAQILTKKSLPINTSTIEKLVGSLFVDSNYIQKTLNWQPPYTLEQGVKKMIELDHN